MDAPGRHLRAQTPELRSGRSRLIVASLAAAVVVPALVVGVSRQSPAGPENPPGTGVDSGAWLAIVLETPANVPAALLLGAPGSHPDLDEILGREGVAAEAFRRSARAVLRQAGPSCSEPALRAAWADALSAVSLPSGVAAPGPGAGEPEQSAIPGEIEEQVRRLLRALPGDSRPKHVRG